MRTRFLAILALCMAVLWSFGEGHRAMASRQLAREADCTWQAQAVKLSAVRDSWIQRQAWIRPFPPASVPCAVMPSPAVTSTSPSAPAASPAPPQAPRNEIGTFAANLRSSLSRFRVRVEECRVGSTPGKSKDRGRTLRLKLLGGKDSLKRAIALMKSDPRIGRLSGLTYEPVRKGEMRAILTGFVRSTPPPRS